MSDPGSRTREERTAEDDRSVGELFGAITADLSTLMREEVALAKAEVRQSATQAGSGVGMLGGSGLAAYLMLLFVSTAGWWALGDAIGRGWAALVVAGVWAVVALVLYALGRSRLRSIQGLRRTTDTAKQVPSAMTGHEEKA